MVLFVMLAVMLPSSALGAGVNFLSFESWSNAQQEARKQSKFLFVDAYTDWCGWCKVMDKNTFANPDVAMVMNEMFVSTKVNMEQGWGIDLAMKYRVTSFPQFLMFSPDGRLVYRVSGYRQPSDFLSDLAKAIRPASQMQFPGITPELFLDWPQFLRSSFLPGEDRINPTAEDVDSWLRTVPNPTAEVPFTVLFKGPRTESWDTWILDNHQQLHKLYSSEADELAMNIAMGRVMQALESKNDSAFQAARSGLPKSHPSYSEAILYADMEQRIRSGSWKGALELLSNAQQAGTVSPYMVNQTCWRVYEEVSDQNILASAASIMNVLDKGTDYAAWDTYAALLFKVGEISEARVAAEKAIIFGRATGDNVSETEELLKLINGSKP